MEKISSMLHAVVPRPSAESRRSQASAWLSEDKAKPNDYILSNDPAAKDFDPPAPVPCKFCGKPQYTAGFRFDNTRIMWNPVGPVLCECPEATADRIRQEAERSAREKAEREEEAAMMMRIRIAEIVGASGMNARFRRRTFESFQQTPDNQRSLNACKVYADTFGDKLPKNNPDPGRNGLFITGPKGTGKTHLAAAIANRIMQEGTAVVCMTMIDLLDRIKQTFEQQQKWGASESSVLKTYKDVPLLIIDDMGKEPATEWAVSKIYAIINARYEAYLPTIITTNYTDAELVRRLTPKDTGDSTTADATIDRLREMCAAIVTTGDSWRSR